MIGMCSNKTFLPYVMYVPYYFSIPKIIYMIPNEEMILVQVDDKSFTEIYIIIDFFSRDFDLF
jgi:hypothetical protein